MNNCACTRWAFDLSTWRPTLTQLAQAVAAVQPEERIRLMKFYFLDDFLSSLVGRLLMRKYVSICTGHNYHELQFARDARGKPFWQQQSKQSPMALSQFSFNVSHQGDFVVLAGVQAAEQMTDFGVGVDTMKIEYSGGKSLSEFFRLMHKKFSDSEWRYITQPQHNEKQSLKAFMRHWCLKEAYVKELGVGITIDLQKLSFSVDMDNELLVLQPLTNATLRCNDVPMHNWHFEEHMLNQQHCVAIAFRNCQPSAKAFTRLQIEELLVPTEKAQQPDILAYCGKALQKQRRTANTSATDFTC